MAKWVHSDVLDNGISAIKANANKQVLLKAYTPGDSYSTVNGTSKLAEVAMASGDYTLGSGSGSSRTLTTAAGKSATASASSGASPDLHIAFVDTVNSKVLWVTATSNATVTVGDTVNFPVLAYTADQPPGAMSAMSQYVDEVAAGRGATLGSAQQQQILSLVSADGILLPDSSPLLFQGDRGIPYIVSGLTLPASGTIGVASITAGVAYVGGMRRAIAGQVLALTASRDNYVDLDQQGRLVVTPVAVAAAAPALTVDSMRLGRVRTDATSVTARAVTGTDSLGNWLFNYISVPYCRTVYSPSTVYTAGDRALTFGAASNVYDNANIHSETVQPTRFTAPTAGLYYVMGVIILASGATSSQWNAKIFKNGASASLGTMSADAAATLTQRAGGIVEAAAGDYFELFLTNSVSVTQSAAAMQVARIA